MQTKNIVLDIGLRAIIGVAFLVSGTAKLPMHSEFVRIVAAYRALPYPLAHFYASVLPWLEITIGTCLILGLFIRIISLVSIPVIASFIVGNIVALTLGQRDDCGCFGALITLDQWWALGIDVLLLVGVLIIFFQRRHFMPLDSKLAHFFRLNRHRSSKR